MAEREEAKEDEHFVRSSATSTQADRRRLFSTATSPPSFSSPTTFQSGSDMRGKGSKSLARRGSPVVGLRGRLSG